MMHAARHWLAPLLLGCAGVAFVVDAALEGWRATIGIALVASLLLCAHALLRPESVDLLAVGAVALGAIVTRPNTPSRYTLAGVLIVVAAMAVVDKYALYRWVGSRRALQNLRRGGHVSRAGPIAGWLERQRGARRVSAELTGLARGT